MKLVLHHFEQLPSTQTSAKAFVLDGAAEGTVIIADKQTDGYGRENKAWYSGEGNLTASIILEPKTHSGAPSPKDYGQLGIMAGLSVKQGIVEALPLAALIQLKWPNDGLLDGRKLFGILIEVFEDAVVIGIGVNINAVPTDASDIATSLLQSMAQSLSRSTAEVTKEETLIDIPDVFHPILKALFKNYRAWLAGEFESIKQQWEESAYLLGQPISRTIPCNNNADNFDTPSSTRLITGIFTGIAMDGAMILRDDQGDDHLVYTN